ncbi:histone H3.1 [Coniosporium apollinis]|uniref:Histone H3.1 n=1 Tax=Coniosporium apollinis TaxID=61459 RepID=A0ABQ9NPE3_9PEZI|nr:histone H3.1 [Coniosporium apollinis]
MAELKHDEKPLNSITTAHGKINPDNDLIMAESKDDEKPQDENLMEGEEHQVNGEALAELDEYDPNPPLAIDPLKFRRQVREILQDLPGHQDGDFRVQTSALRVLQESSEAYLEFMFANAALVAKHRNRITVGTEEIHFALRLRAEQAREAAEAAEALKAEAADHAEQGLEAAVESLVI